MKLVSYIHGGHSSYGIFTEGGVIDLGQRLKHRYPDLKAVIEDQALGLLRDFDSEIPNITIEDLSFLPVIPNPNKILCVGMNYADKRREFNETNFAPTLFIRFADSQCGHNQALIKPSFTQQFDYEGELAIIVGKNGRHIKTDNALDYVAGYSCYMDGSVRDWQYSWFTAGKNWPRTGGFGPYLTTADEVADPHKLSIRTFLNGYLVQEDNTRNMIYKIPELIEYISTFTELSPGDVIITGSPGGVGMKRKPPLFVREGDQVEVDIESVGRLCNRIEEDGISSQGKAYPGRDITIRTIYGAAQDSSIN